MKRLLPLLLALMCSTFCTSCDPIELDEKEPDKEESKPELPNPDDSTETEATYISATQVRALTTDTIAHVKGYIVGYIKDTHIKSAHFGLPDKENTNFLIADSPDVTDIDLCAPVILEKSGSYATRDKLNLYAHPELLGRPILLLGRVEKYFSVRGIKRIFNFKLPEEQGGDTSPEDPEDHNDTPGIDHQPEYIENGR